jgi:Fe2+ transport system protein FeoA
VGDEVTMIEKAPFRGPVLIQIHGSRVALGRKIARKIVVETEGQLEALID